jgi:hypothetical protein
MFSFQYSPNRSSRILDVEIDPRQSAPGIWDADCRIYEHVADGRRLLSPEFSLRGIAAKSEDECLDEVESRIADDIEHDRPGKW